GSEEVANGAAGHALTAQPREPIAQGLLAIERGETARQVVRGEQVLRPHEVALFVLQSEPAEGPGEKTEAAAALGEACQSGSECREGAFHRRRHPPQRGECARRPVASIACEDLVTAITVEDDLTMGARRFGDE